VVSTTSAPSAGAGALKLTVPIERLPAMTVAGFRLSEETEIWDHVIVPVGLHVAPPFVLLNTPSDVPA
jgi:hypothetical protein